MQAFWILTMSSRILFPVITKEDIPFTVNSEVKPRRVKSLIKTMRKFWFIELYTIHYFKNSESINSLNPELNPICYLLALLAHHFLHVSRIMVKSLTLRLLMSYINIYKYIYIYIERIFFIRLLMSYIYGAPILDVSRSHTTTQHSR